MSEISAALVKELRDQTGAGMMDCKRALQETGGDIDAARTLLREKGMAAAGKRADRATTEGIVLVEESGDKAAIVGVGCETEPVSKNEAFREFAEKALERVSANGNGAGAADALEAERVELVAQLGENIVVVDGTRFEGGTLASYVHPPARKIGVLVQLEGGTADLARQVAMHISFAAPEYTVTRRRAAGRARRGAADLPQLGRGAVEAGAGPREDRRGHAREAVPSRRLRAARCSSRRGSTTCRRPFALHSRRRERPSRRSRGSRSPGRDDPPRGARRTAAADRRVRPRACSSSRARASWATASTASTRGR